MRHVRKPLRLTGLFVTVLVVCTLTSTIMAGADPDPLQGTLLQRSNGAMFIYKDGFKYAVQTVQLSDALINAIPDGQPAGLDQLFAAVPGSPTASVPAPAAQAPPSAPSGQVVPVGSGISVVVPQGYTVTTTSNGQVHLDKNGNTSVIIQVAPPQPSTGPIITAVQQDVTSDGHVYVWQEENDLSPAGKASQVTDAPFVTSGYVGGSLQNFRGALVAIARPDASVSLFFITRSNTDDTAAIEAMLASLEQ